MNFVGQTRLELLVGQGADSESPALHFRPMPQQILPKLVAPLLYWIGNYLGFGQKTELVAEFLLV